ncbi:hypothetical protein PR048_005318 [Dryococelus australis]|uniref:LAGLIDADG endonuclease n=1 Tax=Dryococelus australis TaxID=614101 RepID=A0ABQ9I7V7_9NEOP|nr:hypothetical protein PR048_005318 [Dryococelus australis]
MLKPTSDIKYLAKIISVYEFKQLVSSSTRITLTSETLIDLILIKDDSSVSHCAQNSLLGFTDHNFIYLSLTLGSPTVKKLVKLCGNYKFFNIFAAKSVNEKVSILVSLLPLFNKHALLKYSKPRKSYSAWMMSYIQSEMKERECS